MLSEFIIESLKLLLFIHGKFRIPLDHLRVLSDLINSIASISELFQAFTEFDGESKYRFEIGYFNYFLEIALDICGKQDIDLKEYKDQFAITSPDAAEMYRLFKE